MTIFDKLRMIVDYIGALFNSKSIVKENEDFNDYTVGFIHSIYERIDFPYEKRNVLLECRAVRNNKIITGIFIHMKDVGEIND